MKDAIVSLFKASFVLVALYLVLTRAAGSTSIISAGGKLWTDVIKALQGR